MPPFELLSPELKAQDALHQSLLSDLVLERVLSKAISDHETEEEQDMMEENGTSSMNGGGYHSMSSLLSPMSANQSGGAGFMEALMQFYGGIFESYYQLQAKLFSPMNASFFQSLFEYYGPESFNKFYNILDKKFSEDKKKNGIYATTLEFIAGYLRSLKLYENEEMNKPNIIKCFELMSKLYTAAPMELVDDFMDAIIFYIHDRDVKRFITYHIKLLKDFQPAGDGILEKTKYLHLVYYLFWTYGWRGRDVAEAFQEYYKEKHLHDNEKATSYFTGNIACMLYKIDDSSYIDSSGKIPIITFLRKEPIYKEALNKILESFYKEIEEIQMKNSGNQLNDNDSTKDDISRDKLGIDDEAEEEKKPAVVPISTSPPPTTGDEPPINRRFRTITKTLLYLLCIACKYEKLNRNTHPWIMEKLTALCYKLTLEIDKQVSYKKVCT